MKRYFAFQWHITDECEQRCKHCYIFSENNCKNIDSMSWEQMQQVVENCCEMCEKYDRLPYFYITGGDPILHKNFWNLLQLINEKKIPFSILGNPFHLNDNICSELRKYGCQKYQLSLDGMRETHDWFRKSGSFVSKDQPSIIDDPSINNAFYGAPSVCVVFSAKNFLYSIADAFCCAENMVLEATALGISSCIIARAEETFENEFGKNLLIEWRIPENYIARCFVILGYCDGPYPDIKPRKEGRSRIIE